MQILKIKNLSFLLIICASVLVALSCEKDEVPPVDPAVCETENLTYDNFAKNLINGSCATSGCHDVNANANAVPYSFHNYEVLKAAVDDGRILGAINREMGFNPMPKGEAKLSDCNISKMEAWIADGAPN
ncbi:MAG: hypothetical protein ACJA1A_001579 [Saprospiraceae bacterium]|jgi:hypothetical protein|tara:strand:+ start:299 stop:688 length:390 start_codon:yes stop_codon:yes gene_type:complete